MSGQISGWAIKTESKKTKTNGVVCLASERMWMPYPVILFPGCESCQNQSIKLHVVPEESTSRLSFGTNFPKF